jgi:phage repressor protein C with HTH and peptisase S24 domain
MFTHDDIWRLVDRLARRQNISASALAKRAKLDVTSFNRSKRTLSNGKDRWPSTHSLSKILEATETDLSELPALLGKGAAMPQRLPSLPLSALSLDQIDDKGRPAGRDWRMTAFTEKGDPDSLAFRVTDDSMAPVYRNGELLIVTRIQRSAPGQRLVIFMRDGTVLVREMTGRPPRGLALKPVNGVGKGQTVVRRDIRWLYRIRWCQY